ncbi:TonB-dependent receptor domain-containing protein [Ascidiimonas sp. W6]|uniref:TonB-dependent receptor domain-containing protein n=1 Tax=Ascidiimonas meishanensis TaxID=3128903 RepID=UPI0030EBA254
MRKILWFAIIFMIVIRVQSQNRPEQKQIIVKGKIVEKETGQPLEFATISFQNTKRKMILTGAITNLSGEYEVSLSPGTYDIKAEFISFKTLTIFNRLLKEATTLETLALAADTQQLDEVVVRGEKTQVEIKLDKRVYNVGKDLTALGGSVTDVLDNVPAVTVDVEGNIALRGNDNVRILINGKPSALVGLNGTDALRQLPADAIEKVEVITSPSARYDAEGTAGILNIILKTEKITGINGSVTTNLGYPFQAGVSLNLNYRIKKFNFFTNTGYSINEVPGNSFTDTEYLNDDDPSTFTQETRKFDRSRKGLNTNFGVEYFINKSSSIIASMLYRNRDNTSENTNDIFNFDTNRNLTSRTRRFDPETEDDLTIQYSLNYFKNFKKDGHKLTADFQFESSSEDERSIIIDTEIFPIGDTQREGVTTLEDQQRILVQSDYVLPVGKNGQFELGYRGNFVELETDYEVSFENDIGALIPDQELTNVLLYREYVNAVYTQYGNKAGEKISYLLGLRMEDSRISIIQETLNTKDLKTYTDFFPTINLAYEFNQKESITLGYNRRIRRPRSRFINPFPSRSSATNLFQGNPDLDPSYSNTVDVGYIKRWTKISVNGSVYYQRETNAFNFITEETGETVIISGDPNDSGSPLVEVPVLRRTPVNLSTNNRYGFEFTFSYVPSRKWRINTNLNFFGQEVRGDFNGQNFDANNISWFARLNSTYTLPGKINWQTRLFYRGPSETAQSKNEGILTTSLAFSKEIFKDKGNIALSINDVFNSRKRRSDSFTPNTNVYSEFQWRERSFNLTFTYRFNEQENKRKQRRGNGSFEEDDFEG